MSIFMTGATGYLGAYALATMIDEGERGPFHVLTRATDEDAQVEKLWRALQLHMTPGGFEDALRDIVFVPGDLTADALGIDPEQRSQLRDVTRVFHCAASLNRRSAKRCLNANLRGTLSMLKLAQEMADGPGGLERFAFVSTTAVSGQREHACVTEDESIDWALSDYDPYGRTKKFCEHMVAELLPGVRRLIFRPSTVMGDSRFPETTQFDMVRAYCLFADLPAVPLDPTVRQDIVSADFVGRAMASLFLKDAPEHDVYHLSAGLGSSTGAEIGEALLAGGSKKVPPFFKGFTAPFRMAVDAMANGPRGDLSRMSGLMSVFLPYVTNDVVFDNRRVTTELGVQPTPFTDYCGPLYRWAKQARFQYPYAPYSPPARSEAAE